MIILDNREIKLIELIKSNSKFPITYIPENLQIGDIIIRHTLFTTPTNNKTTYNIILERKCITDMIASIKDGRYKEQKIRLLSEIAKNNDINKTLICYILEGNQNELRLPQDKTMLNGSIISSIFRDKIPIIRTYTIQETLDIVVRLHERLIKDYTDFFPNKIVINNINNINTNNTTNNDIVVSEQKTELILEHEHIPASEPLLTQSIQISTIQDNNLYLQSIKKCKKDNITPKLWNQMCYMNIPGISSNIAIKIAENYPTLKSLLTAYEQCSSIQEKELLLAEIILTETDKQKRRIGGVISKRVYDFLIS